MPDAHTPPFPQGSPHPDGRMTTSPYLTLSEAAAYARCSKRSIQRWLTAGTLTRHGHGRLVLIRHDELTALLSPTDAPEACA